MENLWILYWITALPSIKLTMVLIFVLSLMVIISCMLFWGMGASYSYSDKAKKIASITSKLSVGTLIVSIVLYPLIPSKESLYVIISGVGLTEVVRSETVGKFSNRLSEAAEIWLDQNLPTKQKASK